MPALHSLPAELTIYTVAEQLPHWLAWLAGSANDNGADPGSAEAGLRLDASAVVEVDAAGVQLLLSLRQALAAEHSVLEIERPSAALRSACAALGTTTLLGPLDSPGDSL